MMKKTDIAIDHFKQGRTKEALQIAKTFRMGLTEEEQSKLVRAYECMVHAEFYKMIGKNPDQEIEKGKQVFQEKIMKKGKTA